MSVTAVADASPSSPLEEDLAAWLLRGPLTAALVLLASAQLLAWLPHYLTWPYWADHDVFATHAREWAAGRLPYRDLRGNNFPGTIYVFSVLGRVFGWGNPAAFYAFDASLVVGLGALLLAWSRRRFGRFLPGVVGYLSFLSYALGLDYSLAAQRDWQGPCVMVAGLLLAEGWPGRTSRLLSALAAAAAVTIRPQTVLLLPALALALDENARPTGVPLRASVRAGLEWLIAFAVALFLGFAPLLIAGIWGDFLKGIRLATYGRPYNLATLLAAQREWQRLSAPWRYGAVAASIVLLNRLSDTATRRTAWTWLVALAGVSWYEPLSPSSHPYLKHPMALIWSISLTVLVHQVLAVRPAVARLQLAAVLLTLGLGMTLWPDLCDVTASRRAVSGFLRGDLSAGGAVPPGYRHGVVATSAYYPWRDYRAVLDYLRRETSPETRVANVLKGDPAITGPANRHPAFPAEAITWLRMVNPGDEAAFAEALAQSRDSVVVWVPGEVGLNPKFTLDQITTVIRREYRPEARFGTIEVWRRKGR